MNTGTQVTIVSTWYGGISWTSTELLTYFPILFFTYKNTNLQPPAPAQTQASPPPPQTQASPPPQTQAVPRSKRRVRDADTNIENWNISSPSESSTWLINDIDVCQTFYSYQNSVKEKFVEMQGYLEIENSLYDLL